MYDIWCKNESKIIILEKCTKSCAVGNLKIFLKTKNRLITVLRNSAWTKLTENMENHLFSSKMEPKILVAPLFVIELYFAIALQFVFPGHLEIPKFSSKPKVMKTRLIIFLSVPN
jgi:hypothetical protein